MRWFFCLLMLATLALPAVSPAFADEALPDKCFVLRPFEKDMNTPYFPFETAEGEKINGLHMALYSLDAQLGRLVDNPEPYTVNNIHGKSAVCFGALATVNAAIIHAKVELERTTLSDQIRSFDKLYGDSQMLYSYCWGQKFKEKEVTLESLKKFFSDARQIVANEILPIIKDLSMSCEGERHSLGVKSASKRKACSN